MLQGELQTDSEHEEYDAEFGNNMQIFRIDGMGKLEKVADHNTRSDIAYNSRDMQPCQYKVGNGGYENSNDDGFKHLHSFRGWHSAQEDGRSFPEWRSFLPSL